MASNPYFFNPQPQFGDYEVSRDTSAFENKLGQAIASRPSGVRLPPQGNVAYNPDTQEYAVNGQVLGPLAIGDLENLLAESMAKGPLGAPVPQGFQPVDEVRFASVLKAARQDPTANLGSFWDSAKKSFGDTASAVGALFGANDLRNPWAGAIEEGKLDQPWAQQASYDETSNWLSGAGLGTNLAQAGGQLVPAGVATVLSGGNPYVGAAALMTTAGGAQADSGYDQFYQAANAMSDEELMQDSPAYRELMQNNPNMTRDQAVAELAETARRWGLGVGVVEGGIEAILGGKLVTGFLRNIGGEALVKRVVGKPLGGLFAPFTDAAGWKGIGATALAAGTAEGTGAIIGDATVNERAREQLGQNANYGLKDAWQSFATEAPLGFVLGALGRGIAGSPDAPRSDYDELDKSQPTYPPLPPPPPTGIARRRGDEAGFTMRGDDDIVDGEFTDVTPQPAVPALPAPAQQALPAPTEPLALPAPPAPTQYTSQGELDLQPNTTPDAVGNYSAPVMQDAYPRQDSPQGQLFPEDNRPAGPAYTPRVDISQYFNQSVLPLIRQREDEQGFGTGAPVQEIQPAEALAPMQVMSTIRKAAENGLLTPQEANAGIRKIQSMMVKRDSGIPQGRAPSAPTAAPTAAPVAPAEAAQGAAMAETQPENVQPEGEPSVAAQVAEVGKGRKKAALVVPADKPAGKLPPKVAAVVETAKLSTAETKQGTVVTKGKKKAAEIQAKAEKGKMTDAEMAKTLGYDLKKAKSDGSVVIVESKDGTQVLHEELTTADKVEALADKLTTQYSKDLPDDQKPVVLYGVGRAGLEMALERRAKRTDNAERIARAQERQAAKEAEQQRSDALRKAQQEAFDAAAKAAREEAATKAKGKATVDKVKNKRTAPADSQVAAAMETAGVTKEAVTPTELTGLAKIRDVAVKGIEKITKNPKYIKKAKSISTPQEYFDLYEQVEGEPLSVTRRIAFEALFDKVMGTEGKKGVGKPLTSSQKTSQSEKPSTPQTTSATGKQKNSTQTAEKSTRTSDPLFSRNTSGSMTAAELRRKLKTQLARLEKAGIVSVKVIEHVTQLPAHIYAKLGGGTAEGVYDPRTNTVYLIAGEISPARAEVVLAHEVIGHYGIENLLSPSDWAAVKADLNKLAKDPNYKWFFDKVKKNNPNASEAVLMREAVAQIAEYRSKSPIIRKIAKMLKDALRKLGFNFTENGIAEGLAPSVDVALRRSEAYVFGQEFEVVRRRVVSPLASVADIAKLKDTFGGMTLDRFATTFSKDIKQATKTLAQAYSIAEAYISDVESYNGYGNGDFTPVATREKYDYEANLKMPDGSEYDPRNPKHANASDLTLAMAHADRDHYIGIIVDRLNALRRKTLSANAKLISSMVKQGKLSPPEGAMLIHGSARFNYTSKQGEGGIDVRVQEVQPNSQRATMVLSDRIIEAVVKELRSGKKFKDALGDGMTWLYNDGNFRQGRVGWFTYKKSDKMEDAQRLADGAVGREWCTTGLTSAAAQLNGGDFHIYYSEQGEPLIAMRTVNGRVSEVRGSLPQQELTPEEKAIATKAIRSGMADGKDYLHDQEIIEAVIGGLENVSNERLIDMMTAERKSESYFGFGFPSNVTTGIALEVTKRGVENIGVYDRLDIDASEMSLDEVNKRLATIYKANILFITNAPSGRYILPKAKSIQSINIFAQDGKVPHMVAPSLETADRFIALGNVNFTAKKLETVDAVEYHFHDPIDVKFIGSGTTRITRSLKVTPHERGNPRLAAFLADRNPATYEEFLSALKANKNNSSIDVLGVRDVSLLRVDADNTAVTHEGKADTVTVGGLFSSVEVRQKVNTAKTVTSSQIHAASVTNATVKVVPSQQNFLNNLYEGHVSPYTWHSNIPFPLLENTSLLSIEVRKDTYRLPDRYDLREKAIAKGLFMEDGLLPPETGVTFPRLANISQVLQFSTHRDTLKTGVTDFIIDTPELYSATLLPYAPVHMEMHVARGVNLRFSDEEYTKKVNTYRMLEMARSQLEYTLVYTSLLKWVDNVRVHGLQNFNIPDDFNFVDGENRHVVALRVMATVAGMSNAGLTMAIDGAISNNDKTRNLTTAEQNELSTNVGNALINMVTEFLEHFSKSELQKAVDLSVPLEQDSLYVPPVGIVEDTNFHDYFDPPDDPYGELMEGGFVPDENNDEPLFSRKAAEPSDFEPSEDVFKKMADALVDKVKLAGKTKIGATIFETLHSIATLRDQQDTYGTSPTNWGRAYNDLVALLFRKNAFINNQLTKLAEQSRHYMALSADKKKALRELMLASQERSLNPMLALADHAWVSKSLRNHPDVIAAHKELVAMWKALGPDGQRAFKGLADENRRVAIAFIEARIGNYQQLRGRTPDEGGIEGELVDAKLKELKDELSQVKSGNINFSTQRAGDWLVVVPHNGKEGALVGEFKTEVEADAEVQNIKARTPYTKAEVIKVSKDLWEVRINEPTLRTFDSKREAEAGIKALREEIYADLLQTYKGDTAKADEAISKMWETQSPDDPSVMIPKVVPKRRSDAYNEREFGAFAPAQVKRLNDLLRDKKITKVAYMTLMEDYLKSSDATSVTLSRLRRKLVRGAVADDMMTAYVTRYTSMVHALANASVSIRENQLRDQLESAELQNSYIAITGKDPVTAMNALARHEEATATMLKRSASNQFLQTVRGLTTFLNLALSPAYAIMNSTQPHVIGIPYLASKLINGYKVTYAEAAAAVNEAMFSPSAYKRLMDEIAAGVVADSKVIFNKKVTREQFSNDAVEDLVDKWAHGMNPRDKKAFMELVLGAKGTDGKRTGGLMEQDALALSYTDSIYDAMNVTKTGDTVKRFERMAMALGKLTEIGNRLTMARASYRLASERGMSGEALQSFVAEAIYRSQGDFSRTNRAAAFNNPWVGTALQFKTYVQLIYALFLRSANMALRGKTVAERREGRRMLSGMVTAHGLIGGLTGLGPITWMLKVIAVGVFGFGGSDDEDLDEFLSMDAQWRRGIREMLDDPAGEGMLYTALTNGVPAALLGVDASERIAIPSLLDTRFLRIDPNNESASFINGVIAQAVGGAPYSTMLRLYDGGAMILDGGADGDTRDMMLGLAKISPQIIANTIKAFDKDLRGVIDQSGREIIEVDKIGIGDILTNIMGFRTIEETSTQRKRGDFFRAKADVNERRNELLKDYRRARGGDRERLRETIKEFNKTVPPELQITEGTLARSVTAAAKAPDNKDDKALRRSLGLE